MGRLQDKVAIITGSGNGLGQVMAQIFAREGARLTLAARRPAQLEETATLVRAAGGEALIVPTDITVEDQVIEMVRATVAEYGRVDVMVNNAAQPGKDLYVWEQTLENWNNVIAVDVTGAMLCTREVLKQSMLERKSGSIISVSSTAGWSGIPRKSHYTVAKAGLRLLTKVTAQEVGPYGIRCNCLVSGGIEGDLILNYWKRIAGERAVSWETIRDEATSGNALRRICRPEEISALALFLASDESSGITGQSINVDAGSVLIG
jgi:NAD(P)-dependent dehydrogenase (short-subunit alcohol dehydrogenase family)